MSHQYQTEILFEVYFNYNFKLKRHVINTKTIKSNLFIIKQQNFNV